VVWCGGNPLLRDMTSRRRDSLALASTSRATPLPLLDFSQSSKRRVEAEGRPWGSSFLDLVGMSEGLIGGLLAITILSEETENLPRHRSVEYFVQCVYAKRCPLRIVFACRLKCV
jgi:hypothetical protein